MLALIVLAFAAPAAAFALSVVADFLAGAMAREGCIMSDVAHV